MNKVLIRQGGNGYAVSIEHRGPEIDEHYYSTLESALVFIESFFRSKEQQTAEQAPNEDNNE